MALMDDLERELNERGLQNPHDHYSDMLFVVL